MESFVWLAVAAVMAVVEAVSLILVTIWFVIGALAAFLAAFFGASMPAQIVVFLVVSVVCLVAFRPLALKHRAIGQAHEPTPVGQSVVVVEAVDPASLTGRVETPDHMTWAAVSADGQPIPAGESVSVVGQQSIKLVVARA